jgi:hypothetical protein
MGDCQHSCLHVFCFSILKVAEVFTGTPGKLVPLKETIKGFKMVLNGEKLVFYIRLLNLWFFNRWIGSFTWRRFLYGRWYWRCFSSCWKTCFRTLKNLILWTITNRPTVFLIYHFLFCLCLFSRKVFFFSSVSLSLSLSMYLSIDDD